MLEDISAFCTVAEYKSFSKAARHLGVSAAVMTRRIARLETALNIKLLHRTTRLVTLTEAGQTFYAEVRDLLLALESSKKAVSSFNETISGTLKIGLPASISSLHVTPNLSQFTTLYPQLKIELVQGNHLLDLLQNGFDVIIHCGALPDSNFYYQKLGQWTKIICASPAYLKKFGEPKTLQDLSKHACVDHYDNFNKVWKLYVAGKFKEVPIAAHIYSNSSQDLKNLACHDQGIAHLPSFTVHHAIQSGLLISILSQYQPPPLDMFAVYPSHQYLSKKTKVFIQFLIDLLKPVLE